MALTTATTLALVAVAASAAGTGIAVKSSLDQAAAAEDAAKFNQQVAQNNATAAQQQAQLEADKVRRRNLAILGRQRAVFAKNGVLISGSAEDVIYDSLLQGELDYQTALYTGNVQSTYYASQGMLAKLQGNAAADAARLSAAGSILSGVGSMAGAYSRIPTSATSTNFPRGGEPQFGED